MGFKDAGKPHYLGHRERLRRRFREAGADALPDYELLEMILFRAVPRRDTKPLAKAILAHFGSFTEALNAPEERLKEVPGLGEAAITEIKLVRAAALRLMRGEVLERPVLASWSQVLDYCRASMGFEAKEQFRMLFSALIIRQEGQQGAHQAQGAARTQIDRAHGRSACPTRSAYYCADACSFPSAASFMKVAS